MQECSVLKSLPYGGASRAEDYFVRRILPHGRLFHTVRRRLPYREPFRMPTMFRYGRVSRTEESSIRMTVRKTQANWRVVHTEDSSGWKSVPHGRPFIEESTVQKSAQRERLPHRRVFGTQESSTRKSLRYGRVFRTESPVLKTPPYRRLFLARNGFPYRRLSHTEDSSVPKIQKLFRTKAI